MTRPNLMALMATTLVASALAGLEDTRSPVRATEGRRPRRHEPTPEEIEREKAWRAQQEAEANKVRDHYRAERLARKAAAFAKRQPKAKP
jgi:hypothetical protein